MGPITFVVAVNNKQVLADNLLASPCICGNNSARVLIQEGFTSATKAYNDAIERSLTDLIVLVHQDVWLPAFWLSDLERAIDFLRMRNSRWGVLGCIGANFNNEGRGCVYSPGRGVVGKPLTQPATVQTLDELLLIVRKSSGLRFDNNLPHFHFYGADICLRAAQLGLGSYAVPAPCVHNAQHNLILPREFYVAYKYLKQSWRPYLPIHTTCITITPYNAHLFVRKVREFCLRLSGRRFGAMRVDSVSQYASSVEKCRLQ